GEQPQQRAQDGAPSEDGRPVHRLRRRRQPVHHPAFRPRNRFLSCPQDANEGPRLAPTPLILKGLLQPSLLQPEFTSLPRLTVLPLPAILVAFAAFELAIAVAIELFEHLVSTGKELLLRHIAVAVGVKTGEVIAALAIFLVRTLAMMLLPGGLHFFQRHGTIAICIHFLEVFFGKLHMAFGLVAILATFGKTLRGAVPHLIKRHLAVTIDIELCEALGRIKPLTAMRLELLAHLF